MTERFNAFALFAARLNQALQISRAYKMNSRHRTGELPDRNAEYLLYQSLVGAHPLPLERAVAYMEKASKEAKAHTSWIDPNPEYDKALRAFVEGCLGDPEFAADLAAFVQPLLMAGWMTSLSMKLLALTAPGVPDLYQGSELWDLSLVDPDNRRPVDFERRARLLEESAAMGVEEAWQRLDEGLPKLLLVSRALALRRRRPELFVRGSYEPLRVRGEKAGHLVAFIGEGSCVTLAPRLSKYCAAVSSFCPARSGAGWPQLTRRTSPGANSARTAVTNSSGPSWGESRASSPLARPDRVSVV